MSVYIIALVVFVVAVLGMSIGVVLSNRRLRGTCGGLSNLRDERGRTLCDACTTPAETCRDPEEGRRRDRDLSAADGRH